MANEEDLVSQITVTGGPQATAEIQSFADKGSAAFDKLNKSAATSATGIATAAANVEAGAKKASTGLNSVSNSGFNSAVVVGHIKNIENSISNLTQKLPQLTQAVGRFTQRFALVGAAAAASAIGLASAARNIAKSVDGESNSFEKLITSQIDSNNSQLTGTVAAINHASALRQLAAQLSAGKITYEQYTQAVKDTNAQYREQNIVAAQVEAAQASVKLENDRLQKSLADRTAMNKLIDTFGGPLTSSLISFGRQVESVHRQFITAFSPAAASGIDLISSVLTKNATNITKFFDSASAKLQNLITNNGPALIKFFETMGAAAAAVFNGLIDAAPGVLDLFNNKIAPAITKVVAAFDTLALAINAVFGTHLSGGSLILITIIAQMTGAIRLLFALLRAGSGIFKGFIGILKDIGVAIAEAFGAKNTANIVKLGAQVAKGGGPIKAFLGIVRTAIPVLVAFGETVAVIFGVTFGSAIAIIAAVGAALFFLIRAIDWKQFAANAQKAIAEIIAFFAALPGQVISFFTNLFAVIGAANNAATQAVIAAWNAVVDFFTNTLPTAITGAFTALWAGIVALSTTVGQGVIAAWNIVATGVVTAFNTVVAFFQSLPGTLQSVWDTVSNAISSAFQTAIDKVKGFFSDLLSSALSKLQPIIDLLKSIISLGSSASSSAAGAGGGGGGFASGGHIRGPGGPRDDRVPILASNGEFMMQARAVAKYGSAFMQAVNSGVFDLGRFAGGGMIMPAPVQRARFADGGPISSGRPLSLTIGGQTFDGLIAPNDVADQLSKFATIRQVRSAGRKPSWVGRGK